MLWIGDTHTTIVSGETSILVNRIKTANAPFALIGLLGLRRFGDAEPTGTAAERWWRIRLEGPATDSWEVIDRSPEGSWLVTDDGRATRIEPTSVAGIVGRICATLEPVITSI
jgi:hypothetical protein